MGRIDICIEVSVMSSYVAWPRELLQELLKICAYLKCHHNTRLVFDPSYLDLDESFNYKSIGRISTKQMMNIYQIMHLSHKGNNS